MLHGLYVRSASQSMSGDVFVVVAVVVVVGGAVVVVVVGGVVVGRVVVDVATIVPSGRRSVTIKATVCDGCWLLCCGMISLVSNSL